MRKSGKLTSTTVKQKILSCDGNEGYRYVKQEWDRFSGCARILPQMGYVERLEPDEGKPSRPVLRGGNGSNAISLPGDLDKIKAMEVPVMSQAINAYYSITASSEFKEKERLCAKAWHDEAQALSNARKVEKLEIAHKMIKRNRPIDEIIEDTGLTHEEVEGLLKQLTSIQVG